MKQAYHSFYKSMISNSEILPGVGMGRWKVFWTINRWVLAVIILCQDCLSPFHLVYKTTTNEICLQRFSPNGDGINDTLKPLLKVLGHE